MAFVRSMLALSAFLGIVNGLSADAGSGALETARLSRPTSTDANALVERGRQAFERGAFSQAATDWERAVGAFRRAGNTASEVTTSVSLANAYQALGQQRRATEILEAALARAEKSGDS